MAVWSGLAMTCCFGLLWRRRRTVVPSMEARSPNGLVSLISTRLLEVLIWARRHRIRDYPGALHSAHAPSHLEGDQEFADSPLEQAGFELVWGFSCQVVVLGFAESSLFGAGKPLFIPSPAIRFAERAEGVKGPKR
jgi:hypothetical protein